MPDGDKILNHLDYISNLEEEINTLHSAKRQINEVIRASEARQQVISSEVTELETRKQNSEMRLEETAKEMNKLCELIKQKNEKLGSLLAEITLYYNAAEQEETRVKTLRLQKDEIQTIVESLVEKKKHLEESVAKLDVELKNSINSLDEKRKSYADTLEKYNVLELKFNNLDSDYKKKVAQLDAELQKKIEKCNAYDVGKIMQDFELAKIGLEKDFEARKRQIENDISTLNKGIEKAVEEFELKKLQFLDAENKHNDLLIAENKKLLEVKRERAEIEAENKRKKAQEIINTLK